VEALAHERPRQLDGDVMHRGLVSCAVETPLRAAAALMARHEIHCVVVIDRATQRPIGVRSTLDVARSVAA
jgi:CBS domain-containing protein